MNPFFLFQEWLLREQEISKVRIPTACCLSTIGTDGYPNARFVSLKEVRDRSFVITGPLLSRKGQEIESCPKVALTFWWPATERQVRIQGDAQRIDTLLADRYFSERPREAQLVSAVSEQGKEMEDETMLETLYAEAAARLAGEEIQRPQDWGGYAIAPVRIEFMEFRSTRFHERRLFFKEGEDWAVRMLQP